MRPVGYGVIGASSFVATRAVIPAIEAADGSFLAAAASISAGTGSYEDVLAHPDVEVVYVPLPNGRHRDWTERAAAAGKHVLCEKPTALDAGARLIILNAEPTAFDELADAVIREPIGRALPCLIPDP